MSMSLFAPYKFKYNYLERRFYKSNYNYSDYIFSKIIKVLPLELFKCDKLPIEMVVIIYTIKLLLEEKDFEIYMQELYSNSETELYLIYKLRNRSIYKKNTLGYLEYNLVSMIQFQQKKNKNKIGLKLLKLYRSVMFNFYEWLKTAYRLTHKNNLLKLIDVLTRKIYQFKLDIIQNDIRSIAFNNDDEINEGKEIINSIIFLIEHFSCRISPTPCNKCYKFDLYVNENTDWGFNK